MKVNFNLQLCDLNGQPYRKNDVEKTAMTLKDATQEALFSILEADRNDSGAAKYARFQIAQKVHGGGEVDLTPEEIAVIKARIGDAFGAAVVGPAFKILNG
jgi:hypothetical protein